MNKVVKCYWLLTVILINTLKEGLYLFNSAKSYNLNILIRYNNYRNKSYFNVITAFKVFLIDVNSGYTMAKY